jgi:hypothetical protein
MTSLLFSRDPGGARQMFGLLQALRGRFPNEAAHPGIVAVKAQIPHHPPLVFAKDFAIKVFAGLGEAAEAWPLPEARGPDRDRLLDALLAERGVTVVLTATSDVDDDTDQALWQAARRAGIPSHGFVDGAFNVAPRFTSPEGDMVVPDFVHVPNRAVFDEVAPYCPTGRITLIPDLIIGVHRQEMEQARTNAAGLRRQWGLGEGERAALFASENVEELVALGKPKHYDEYDCLALLLAALAGERAVPGIAAGAAQLVVIRPHPKERPDKFAAHCGRAGPRVIISTDGTASEAILAADLVVGMRSTLLREALDAGKAVVSLVGHDIRGQAS